MGETPIPTFKNVNLILKVFNMSENKEVSVVQETIKAHSIVGVVGDVRREMSGHHYAEVCSVFGINSEEFTCMKNEGMEIKPKKFSDDVDRYQVLSSPFKVMKILSEYFGYTVPVCPIEGQVKSDAGERRTCIFTIQN